MAPLFDHERLEVYQLGLRFVAFADRVIIDLPRRVDGADHLDRASTGMVLNIAEGNGKASMRDRVRFLEISKGSALECAASLDVLVVKNLLDAAAAAQGKERLVPVVRMRAKVIESCLGRIAEAPAPYGGVLDVEQKQEHE